MSSLDIAFKVFARINDFLPKETIVGLRNAMEMNGAEEFSRKHGPNNYALWSRDIHIIQDTVEVLGVTEYAPS